MNRMRLVLTLLLVACLGSSAAANSTPRTQAATTPNPAALLRQSITAMQSVHSSRSTSLITGIYEPSPVTILGKCARTGTRITASWSGEAWAEEALIWSLSPSWVARFTRLPGKSWRPAAGIPGYSTPMPFGSHAPGCSLIWIKQLELQPPTDLRLVGSTVVGGEFTWRVHATVAGVPADLFVGQQTHRLLRVTTWVTGSDLHPVLDTTTYSGFNDPITITLPFVKLPSPARGQHTAVRLSDGRVLVVGDNLAGINTVLTGWAEVYNPATGTWSRVDLPAAPLADTQAVALRGGRVVASASFFPVLSAFGSKMIFDPARNAWKGVPASRVTRQLAVLVALKDGRLLVAGGISSGPTFRPLKSVEVYNPATGRWATIGSVPKGLQWGPTLVLKDGRVLVVGRPAEIFTPADGTWARAAAPPTGMFVSTLWPLPSGRVLAVGSPSKSSQPLVTAIFNPASNAWSGMQRSPLKVDMGNYGFATVLLRNGTLLVAGGAEKYYEDYSVLAAAWLFDPASGRWTKTGSMTTARTGHTLTLLKNGTVLAVGGYRLYDTTPVDKSGLLSSAELYNPATGRWTKTGSMK